MIQWDSTVHRQGLLCRRTRPFLPTHEGMTRLSSPAWLIKCQDGVRAQQISSVNRHASNSSQSPPRRLSTKWSRSVSGYSYRIVSPSTSSISNLSPCRIIVTAGCGGCGRQEWGETDGGCRRRDDASGAKVSATVQIHLGVLPPAHLFTMSHRPRHCHANSASIPFIFRKLFLVPIGLDCLYTLFDVLSVFLTHRFISVFLSK